MGSAINIFSTPPLSGKSSIKVIDVSDAAYILSDNLVIHDGIPSDVVSLTNSLIFPLTETRIFLGLKGNYFTFTEETIKYINAMLVLQANRYFGSTNKFLLNDAINLFKTLCKFPQACDIISKDIFQMINK